MSAIGLGPQRLLVFPTRVCTEQSPLRQNLDPPSLSNVLEVLSWWQRLRAQHVEALKAPGKDMLLQMP